jgi:hypothetical protein
MVLKSCRSATRNLESSSVEQEPFDVVVVIFQTANLMRHPVANMPSIRNKRSQPNSPMDQHRSAAKPGAKLGSTIRGRIGQQLHVMYDEVVKQGVPPRFVEILGGLDHPNNEGSKDEPW